VISNTIYLKRSGAMTTRQDASWIGLGTSYGCLGVPEQVCFAWSTRVSGKVAKLVAYH
jgi:hypothetical protein